MKQLLKLTRTLLAVLILVGLIITFVMPSFDFSEKSWVEFPASQSPILTPTPLLPHPPLSTSPSPEVMITALPTHRAGDSTVEPTSIHSSTPTPVPLSLPTPASDASGSIWFLSEVKTLQGQIQQALFYVVMDEVGQVKTGEPVLFFLFEQSEWSFQGLSQLFPSPGEHYLAVSNPSVMQGQSIIVDLQEHRLLPLRPPQRENILVLGHFVGWHPDEQHVLYVGSDNDTGLWLLDVQDEQPPQYLSSHTPDSAAISPDGQNLIFAERTVHSDVSNLWLAWSDGTHEHILSEIPGQSAISELSWSPDGKSIAYGAGGTQIWLLPLGKVPRLLSNTYMGGYGYQWSPDGQFIVYVSREIPQEKPPEFLMPYTDEAYEWAFSGLSLRIVNVETGEDWRLNQDEWHGDVQPCWSPDGTNIVFSSLRSGRLAVWVNRVDGSNLRQVIPAATTLRSNPIWLTRTDGM